MKREIVRDMFILRQKSAEADVDSPKDIAVAKELSETLLANSDRCVGMAANMIGVHKRIIVFFDGKGKLCVMFNPVITEKTDEYRAAEGCLSLDGQREAVRYKTICVEYTDDRKTKRKKYFRGETAQIIQHECDHLDGKII